MHDSSDNDISNSASLLHTDPEAWWAQYYEAKKQRQLMIDRLRENSRQLTNDYRQARLEEEELAGGGGSADEDKQNKVLPLRNRIFGHNPEMEHDDDEVEDGLASYKSETAAWWANYREKKERKKLRMRKLQQDLNDLRTELAQLRIGFAHDRSMLEQPAGAGHNDKK